MSDAKNNPPSLTSFERPTTEGKMEVAAVAPKRAFFPCIKNRMRRNVIGISVSVCPPHRTPYIYYSERVLIYMYTHKSSYPITSIIPLHLFIPLPLVAHLQGLEIQVSKGTNISVGAAAYSRETVSMMHRPCASKHFCRLTRLHFVRRHRDLINACAYHRSMLLLRPISSFTIVLNTPSISSSAVSIPSLSRMVGP
jgi:hypothetical protein